MKVDRRSFIVAGAATSAMPSRLGAQSGAVFRPEDFGARGDGTTNDQRAFASLSDAVNKRGGGTIALRSGRTYVVGSQSRGPGRFGWNPNPIVDLNGLTAPLAILGNGARLLCQPGLRFGIFDPASGERVDRPLPYYERSGLAIPYRAMIMVQHCRSTVEIRDLELDGNVAELRIGGRYGDKGWQVPATGLMLVFNQRAELVERINSHHQAHDGVMIIGDPGRSARSAVRNLACRDNGRQGLSITAGRGYDFTDCEFTRSGRSVVRSAPAAGVDIEAERQRLIRDLSFTRCSFVDNAGCGLLANNGDVAGARFVDCRFVGTSKWSAWPNKPGFVFTGCTFVGSVVNAFADADPARATKFSACVFTDDPKLSPSGAVYTAKGPIVKLARSDNVAFDRCRFSLVAAGALPWTNRAIYRDCVMAQRSAVKARPGGRFLGTTTIHGPVEIGPSQVDGVLVVNGRTVPRTSGR
jgi:hypothetical protein